MISLVVEDTSGQAKAKKSRSDIVKENQLHVLSVGHARGTRLQKQTGFNPFHKYPIQDVITRLKRSKVTKEELAKFKDVKFDIPSAGVKIGEISIERAREVGKDCCMALEQITVATAAMDLEYMLR